MAHHGRQSSAKLEREVRAQRAEISETLTEIRERLSPGQLLDAALRSTGTRQNVSRIGSVMVRNPLPVMLIGVGVLWLALSNNRPPRLTDSRRTRRPGHPIEGNTLMAVSRDNLTAWLRDAARDGEPGDRDPGEAGEAGSSTIRSCAPRCARIWTKRTARRSGSSSACTSSARTRPA